MTIDGDPRTTRAAFERQLGSANGARPTKTPELQRRLDEFTTKLRKRGFYEASGQHARNDLRGQDLGRPGDRRPVGPRRHGALRGRSAACRPAEGAGAGRAGELRDRRSPRGFDCRDPRLSAPAGVLERRTPHGGERKLPTRWPSSSKSRRACGTTSPSRCQLSGNQAIATDELRTMIALKPGELFLESGLSGASAAITELYRQRGFVSATVKYSVVETDPRRPTRGRSSRRSSFPKARARSSARSQITGNSALSEPELRPRVKLAEGQPFYQPQLNADRDALIVEYLNNGFSSRRGRRHAGVLEPTGRAPT